MHPLANRSCCGCLLAARYKRSFGTLAVAVMAVALCSCKAEMEVAKVGPPRYGGAFGDSLQAACDAWQLSAWQVERFFRLSERYASTPYSDFYQVPCSISGELQTDGRIWTFEINGGGAATLRAGGRTRYWGCRAEECGTLVLLEPDLMDPDRVSP